VLTNSPQVAANQVVNEKGVSISLLAGGQTNRRSLNHKGKSFYAEAFGVPWFHLFLYIGTHAGSAEEAIQMLTVGTQGYRSRSGRKSLLRCGGWNFLVADAGTLAVVEASADRYAVRYAGDMSVFTGPDWKNPDYIVVTNHFICDFSHDKDNKRTDVPMTIFMDGYKREAKTGEIVGLNDSGNRFWTLMWDARHHLGRIDRYRAQQIMSGAYGYNKETGEKIQVAQDRKKNWRIYGSVRFCTIGIIARWGGTCDAKIAVIKGGNAAVYWTLGSPLDWQGAWDAFRF
jgi:YD repeat-containing protein